ncbi:hypothetical protein FSP39_015777 [Pinctada imbricata]|uniref:Uncharacterized protein n=1 Tax=Pinctada imbricata TaxID=66713 RepID=A0AA89BZI6_PINIB|nr:hypothetical protein FSP39_015777 [Pinctada imbricata]
MSSVQQSISYQSFLREQRIKLSSRYPFLSKSQINGKVKDLWNKLAQEEKEQYTKTSLIKTPTKSARKQNKPRSKTGKWTCFNTPELFFEDRNNGESDFADASVNKRSPVDKRASAESKLEDSDWFFDDSWDRTVHSKTKGSSERKPGNNLTNTGGILKNAGLKDTPAKTKENRVSFAHEPDDEREVSEVTQPSQDCSYSDDEDAMLICRNDVNFDDVDNHEIEIEKEGTDPVVRCETGRKSCTDQISGLDAKYDEDERSGSNVHEVINNKVDFVKDVSDNEEIGSKPESVSDSEIIEGKRKIRKGKNKRKAFTKQKKQQKGKFRSPDLIEKKGSENKQSKVTPMVKINAYQDVTPMMDEETLKQNLAEVSKAPRKRRSVMEGKVSNLSTQEEKGQRKKSRLSMKNASLNGNNTECVDLERKDNEQLQDADITNAAGDATRCGRRRSGEIKNEGKTSAVKSKQKRRSSRKKSLQSADQNTEADSNNNDISNNDSQTLFNFETEESVIPDSLSSNGEDESDLALFKKTTSTSSALRRVLSMMRKTVASPCSPTLSLTDRSDGLLSPALSGISTLSSLSSESGAITASPLMERFSQYEDKKSRKERTVKSPATVKNQSDQEDEFLQETRTKSVTKEEGSLCEMFQNITPPEKKVQKKKTRRLLASAVMEKLPSIFSDGLNEADIFS